MCKQTIWLDMDGCIAQSLSNIEDYDKDGAFANLPLIAGAQIFVHKLQSLGFPVRILTKTFSIEKHEQQVQEKSEWLLRKFGYDLCYGAVFLKPNQSKSEFILEGDVLIDDYGGNCRDCELHDGIAIQIHEHKDKGWFTACDFTQCIEILKVGRDTWYWLGAYYD